MGYSTSAAQPLLNIHDIAALPEWRGRSIAKHLLDAIDDLGHKLGCCRITLEVREDNITAQRLYQRNGFHPAQCALSLEKSL